MANHIERQDRNFPPEDDALKPFMASSLPSIPIDDDELITDVIVVYRVAQMSDGAERFSYTTSIGTSFAMGRGMLDCVQDEIANIYMNVIEDEPDGT